MMSARDFRLIPGGRDDGPVISSELIGRIYVQHDAKGWSAWHQDWQDDHAGSIETGLPSKADAVQAALYYAQAILSPFSAPPRQPAPICSSPKGAA